MDDARQAQNKQANSYKGLTPPLSTAEPTDDEIKQSQYLEEMMKKMGVFESQEGMDARMDALACLQSLACEWIREMAVIKSYPPHMAETVGGVIFTFGSYRLGVNTRGADVDAVLVSPKFVERSEFFETFFERLKEHPKCSSAHAVSDAYVPVIKMTFMRVDIDLLFARLDMQTVPQNIDLRENTETLLRNLDERCVRSINGCRVTDEILNQVPNHDNFRGALKVIRIWAKNRGIYSNAMGFLGGVSWAILLARIAQLYPNAAPSMLIIRFFYVLTQWDWPKPIELCEVTPPNLHFPEWDPRTNIKDQFHLMPIITPVYPRQNSTYNVGFSTKQVIIEELQRGRKITNDIMFRKKTWEELVQPVNFFHPYKHFVIVIASSETAELHLDFQGLVESQLRKLVLSFEHNGAITRAHVNTDSYGKCNDSEPDHISKWFIAIVFTKAQDPTTKLNVDLTFDITNFIRQINQMANNHQLNLDVVYSRKRGLAQHLPRSEHWKIKTKPANSTASGSRPSVGGSDSAIGLSPSSSLTSLPSSQVAAASSSSSSIAAAGAAASGTDGSSTSQQQLTEPSADGANKADGDILAGIKRPHSPQTIACNDEGSFVQPKRVTGPTVSAGLTRTDSSSSNLSNASVSVTVGKAGEAAS